MASIYSRSTILVEPLPIGSFTKMETKIEEEPLLMPRPGLLAWAQYLWHYLCICYAYWNLLGDVPLELLLPNVYAAPASAAEDVYLTVEEQNEDDNKRACPAGQLALHPNFPLLAVSTQSSTEIGLYNTVNSQQICRFDVITPKLGPHDQSRKGTVITCLQFSCGNVLAVGLSDGTVRIVEQQMGALINSTPDSTSTRRQPEVQEVNFFPGHSSDISARFLGPVTNLIFAPTSKFETGVNAWLAVATEQSGVWIWNRRSKQTFRAFRTAGVKQGNLHWVRLARELDTGSEPLTQQTTLALAEKIPLSQSTVQRFESVLGNAQDMLKLDECFAPASTNRPWSQGMLGLPQLPRRPPPANVADTDDLDGQTVLVVGQKSGQVRVQKLWHSSTMIHMETFVDFPLRHLANSRPLFPLKFQTAEVEISHLVTNNILCLARKTVIVPMLVAFSRETSSKLHEVVVHLPFEESAQPISWSHFACDGAKTILRYFVNFTLSIIKIDYEWLPDIFDPPIDDSVLAVSYHGARSVQLDPSSSFSRASLVSLSMRPHQHPATDAVFLATLRPAMSEPNGNCQRSSCVLLSPGDPEVSPSTVNQLTCIIPQIPNPFLPTPFPVQPKPLARGYYSRMLAEIDRSNDHHVQIPYARTESLVEHDYTCGQARWGMSRNGRVLGAFLYQPASLLDPGIGVALFEVGLNEDRKSRLGTWGRG